MTTKIYLVTGANGHLGNNLVRALLDRGETVRASLRNPNNREPFAGLDCEIVQADLMDKEMELGAKMTGNRPRTLRSQVKLFCDNPRVMNINKARTELGYDPRDGETAVRQALVYLMEDNQRC